STFYGIINSSMFGLRVCACQSLNLPTGVCFIAGMDRQSIPAITARILLETQAIHFNAEQPFTLTSGCISPVYIDCRKLISFPRARRTLMDMGASLIIQDIGCEQFDCV